MLSISEEGLAIAMLCYVVAAAVVINHRLVITTLKVDICILFFTNEENECSRS